MKLFEKVLDVGKKILLPGIGAAVGMYIASCFSVEKGEDFDEDAQTIDAEFTEVEETEEV